MGYSVEVSVFYSPPDVYLMGLGVAFVQSKINERKT